MNKYQLRMRKEARELTFLMWGCLGMALLAASLLTLLIKESI